MRATITTLILAVLATTAWIVFSQLKETTYSIPEFTDEMNHWVCIQEEIPDCEQGGTHDI